MQAARLQFYGIPGRTHIILYEVNGKVTTHFYITSWSPQTSKWKKLMQKSIKTRITCTAQYCDSHIELAGALVPLQSFSEIPLKAPANMIVYLIQRNHSLDHFPVPVQIAAINRPTALILFHCFENVGHKQTKGPGCSISLYWFPREPGMKSMIFM